MAVTETQNPGTNPAGGWFGDSSGHRKAALKGWRGRKRGRRRRRRRRNPTSNPDGARIPLLQGITAQDIAVGGACFLLVGKVSEVAAQTGWTDVAVMGFAAVACGMVVGAALPASKRAAVIAAMVPAAVKAVSLLSNGRWGLLPAPSAPLSMATGLHNNPVDIIRIVPSPMGI